MTRLKTAVKVWGEVYEVDECASLEDIGRAEPVFFEKCRGRQREHFEMYRGCVIVRYTPIALGGERTERRTVPYLFGQCDGKAGTFCISTECKNIRHAYHLIDQVLDRGILRE